MSTPLRVLLVSDSTHDTDLLLQTLRDGGYEPLWEGVKTAAAMTAALKQQPWELVLCAHVPPLFSPMAALNLLQEKGFDIPFLIVTDKKGEESAVAAMKAGAHDYVLNDNLVRLVPAIERELREARGRRVYRQTRQKVPDQTKLLPSGTEASPPHVIFILASDGNIRYVSSSSEQILGYQSHELLGANIFAYLHLDDEQNVRTAFAQAAQNCGASSQFQFRFRHRNSSWCTLVATTSEFHDDREKTSSLILTSRDLSSPEKQVVVFKERVLRDALTDVSTRILFHDYVQQAILAAQQKSKSLALLLISLDHFREIMKTFGHQWGEALFQYVGSRIRSTLRKSDTLARGGGDEFAVLLPPGGDTASAILVAQRILKALEQPFVIEGQALAIRTNIGIALYPEHGTDAQTLMRRADVATDIAARTGSGYALYTAEYDRYSRERLLLVNELHEAVKRNQLLLHYQPKAHIASGHINHVEALIRWHHPKHGLMLPEQFLSLAEETGLIKSISFWVLNTALQQCALWQKQGIELCVALNFSLQHDLQDPQLPDIVAQSLQEYGVPPTCLEVEITESPVTDEPKQALAVLNRLRDLGVKIAIDDFGTGYSSLMYLKQLPVDEIKIDKSLIIGMAKDESSAAIVRSTIDLGHELGLQVAAEGVEDQATWNILATLGCDFAQGYYLSRPIPATALTQWLQEPSGKKGARSPLPLAPPRRLRRHYDAVGKA